MKKLITTLIITLSITLPCFAGSNQNAESKFTAEQITRFAKNVEKYAAEQGARAFIIARVGRPQSELPKGIRFTHTAIAIYSNITLADGEVVKGYAIHNLYQQAGKPEKSDLVIDYPVDFFWGAEELTAGIIIPNPELQLRIIEVISSGQNRILHNNNYSVIANPFNSQFQNCTEHTLDVINAAIYQTTEIEQLKINAKAHFNAQKINTNPLKLTLGSMFMDDVTTQDHQGKVYTSTFTTIGNYLTENQLASEVTIFQ